MKTVLVIDGQGGKLGRLLIEQLRETAPPCEIVAIGTNSIATATMLKAGADAGATGENPVITNCRHASIIVGPIGILVADAMYGEVTPAMALAVGQSTAQKVLLPVNRCSSYVVGVKELPVGEVIALAVAAVKRFLNEGENY